MAKRLQKIIQAQEQNQITVPNKELFNRFPEIVPNQNKGNKSNNKGNNTQQGNHISSLSPHKEEIENKTDNGADNNGQIISIFNTPFNHDFTSLTSDKEIKAKKPVINNPETINKTNFDIFSGLINNGEITPAVNQATAILPKISEADLRWPMENSLIYKNLTQKESDVKFTNSLLMEFWHTTHI